PITRCLIGRWQLRTNWNAISYFLSQVPPRTSPWVSSYGVRCRVCHWVCRSLDNQEGSFDNDRSCTTEFDNLLSTAEQPPYDSTLSCREPPQSQSVRLCP